MTLIKPRIKPTVKSRLSETKECFISGPSYGSNMKRSTETIEQLHKIFKDVFNGIGCLDDTFSLQLLCKAVVSVLPIHLLSCVGFCICGI